MNPTNALAIGRHTLDVLARVQRQRDHLEPADWFALNQLAAQVNRLVRPIADDQCFAPALRETARSTSVALTHEMQATSAHIPDEWVISKLAYQ